MTVTIKDINKSVSSGEEKEDRFITKLIKYLSTKFPGSRFEIVQIPGASDIDRLIVKDGLLFFGMEYKERNTKSSTFKETICRDLKHQTAIELRKHLKIPSFMFIRFLKDDDANNYVFKFNLEKPSRHDDILRVDRNIKRKHAFYSLKDSEKIEIPE